jgi:hypothetical protein
MESIAWCESCGEPLHEGDDHHFDPYGLVWVCRSCIEVEEARLRNEYGWIGAWKGNATGGNSSPGREVG